MTLAEQRHSASTISELTCIRKTILFVFQFKTKIVCTNTKHRESEFFHAGKEDQVLHTDLLSK